MAVLIFSLLSIVPQDEAKAAAGEPNESLRNGIFSAVAFVIGAVTSCLSGFLGMRIATYANARTAVEARKGIAPAFMCGEWVLAIFWWQLASASPSSFLAPIESQSPSPPTRSPLWYLTAPTYYTHPLIPPPHSLPVRSRHGLPAVQLGPDQPVRRHPPLHEGKQGGPPNKHCNLSAHVACAFCRLA